MCFVTVVVQTTGKILTKWSGRNRFNPIKMRRPNTPDTKVLELDRINIKDPILTKVCDRFGLSCSYCKQGAMHPSSQELDWSSVDWDGTKAKVGEQTDTLMDYNTPKPQSDIDTTTDVKEVAFSKLQIGQSNLQQEVIEMTDSLIPPPPTETPGDMTGKNDGEELSDRERQLQQEEEKYDLYQRIYVGELSEEEESNTESDSLT